MKLHICAMLLAFLFAGRAFANCDRVGDAPDLKIDTKAQTVLDGFDLPRPKLFELLQRIATPETGGCWAGIAGDFDGQISSLGVFQWNYGQGSIQPLLINFRKKLERASEFRSAMRDLMPQFGDKLVFSPGCLRNPITVECKSKLLAQQDAKHNVKEPLRTELTNLLQSPAMKLVQMDKFIKDLTFLTNFLDRMFGKHPNFRQIKWTMDLFVQQGKDHLPSKGTVELAKSRVGTTDEIKAVTGMVDWYVASAQAPLGEGVGQRDREFNREQWNALAKAKGIDDEKYYLLWLSFLEGRRAQGRGGDWQALAFERRAKIALGIGSVAGNKLPEPN